MTIRSTAIAIATAAAIGITSLVPAGPAEAAGFAPIAKAELTTEAAGLEEVGGRKRYRRHRRHRNNAAAAAIVGLGAFALGAAIASQHQPRRCVYQRVKVWDPYIGAYVIERRRVC
jgi:hypothetical protein